MLELIALAYLLYTPPAKYDYPASDMQIVYATPEHVIEHCKDPKAIGCAFVTRMTDTGKIVKCVIYLPYGAGPMSEIYRHEQAHCNGWPTDHSNG